MATRVPPVSMDPLKAAEFLRQGFDLDEFEAVFARVLSDPHHALPDPPASVDARLFSLLPHDRVSSLPDVLLGNIVSRLPIKEAARTAALSRRVHLSAASTSPDAHALALDAHALAPDARREGNPRTRPLQPSVPTRLPSPGHLPRHDHPHPPLPQHLEVPGHGWRLAPTCFPNLRELGFISVIMESKDLDFILDRSAVLETLCVGGNMFKIPLRLFSQSLRCVQIVGCSFADIVIAVVDAPCLERLIYSGGWTLDGSCTKVKIGHAPKLHLLGYLDAGNHVLVVRKTVIKAGTKASPSTVVPTVRILALEVCFRGRNGVKMIPAVLRCFPSVETLHIMSGKTDQPSGKVNLKFWNESGTIECIRSCIKLLVFHDFRGDRSELVFLKFFLGSALVLKEAVIVFADASCTSLEDMRSKVVPLGSMKRASAGCSIRATRCSNPESSYMRSFKKSSDFSLRDPFAN